jgi:dipeptidyl aminopeptidase/acylaminoacyl peptidase
VRKKSRVSEQQTTVPDKSSLSDSARRIVRSRRVWLAVIVALAVVAGVVGWLVATHDDSSSSTVVSTPITPVALSASGLRTLAVNVGQPIYWAGPREGYLYELSRTDTGAVYIRYLPPGVNAGAKGAKYLIVATYPFGNALDALKNVTKGKGIELPGGGLALVDRSYPKSVHVAFPRVDYQVEVFDPSPARALEVATSGEVQPVR